MLPVLLYSLEVGVPYDDIWFAFAGLCH